MIETQQASIQDLINTAISHLETEGDTKLISYTKEITDIDPLTFFRQAETLGQNRIFWTSTADHFYITGVGNAWEITAERSPFAETEREWNRLMEDALIHNPYKLPGTGLNAMGGMDFDPEKEKTALWKNFQPSQFTVPAFMLTKRGHSCYLTTNFLVKYGDHPFQLANQLEKRERELFANNPTPEEKMSIEKKTEIAPDAWKQLVKQTTEDIANKQAGKIVLARELRLKFDKKADIAGVLDKLLATQSNSFIFAFEKGEDCFIGATPERLVKLESRELLSTCLAGTAPRGKTVEEDAAIADELLHDEKNLQEHKFVVEMIKQAMLDYCEDVMIPEEPVIYPLRNLQHLYTPVTATLKSSYSIFDVIGKLHPTPALGGVPRKESMAYIRKHEQLDRGWYGAPIGWLDSNGNGEFAVAIRSGLIQGDEASLFAGCGVVKDSDPEAEYEETNIKFTPMLSVMGEGR
ncbi:isochorismate synthase [Lentibacillus sediminis]|uniref:isochorismate synthase n=1 Tax=Lentibacillus sediminis TaxID=1940529 RepID=UPI000C1C14B0|nr:isochorismate synthase [Lentibacillus sediminis]